MVVIGGRFRLISALVVLAWLGLAGWIALDLDHARQRELAAAGQVAATLTTVLDRHLRATVEKIDFRLQEFIDRHQQDVVTRVPRERLEQELKRTQALFPEASSFRVADARGNYLYDASGQLAPVNIADRDYFRRLRDDPGAGLVCSEPITSRITGSWVIVLARRLEDRSGQFIGIVLAAVNSDYFERFYATLDVGRDGVVALWNKEQQLIARWPRRDDWVGRRLTQAGFVGAVDAGRDSGGFVGVAQLDGVRRIHAYRVAEQLPFVVVVGLSEAEVLAGWYHRGAIYAGLGLLLLAVVLAAMRIWHQSYGRVERVAAELAAAYEEKTRQGRALMDSIPDPAWLLDTEGRFLAVNEAYASYLGRPMDAIVGRTVHDLFAADEADRLREGQLAVYRQGQPVRQEVWLHLAGKKRPFEFLRSPVYGEDGQAKGLAGVAWDMSHRYEAESRQRLITHVFDNSSEAILILDAERRVVTFNQAVTQITGYRLDEVAGQRARCMAAGLQGEAEFDAIADAMDRSGSWRGELSVHRRGGGSCPVFCNATAIRDDCGKLINWAVFVTDISERKAAEERIDALVHVDQLTALPSRQGFARALEAWLAEGRAFAVIVVDLDQLNRVNDAFGHEAGDLVLTTVSHRLRRKLREGDLLGRLGAQQFGIVVAKTGDPANVEAVARKLLDAVARPVRIGGSDIVATACAGICLHPEDGADVGALLRNADAAMHCAREAGQEGCRFYDGSMNRQRAEGLRLESDLRWALPRRELSLHYQPQIDIAEGRLTGFEALLRWEHPELGRISPDRFIPLAEESQLILPIGGWVLWEACRQNKAWQDAGYPPVVVAVNLSAVQFHGADLLSGVARVLAETGLAPRWLELEITESVIMDDPGRVVRVLEKLKELGVGLSIDDFGTGYSSLSYLKRFPIDKIKIDRSFINDIVSDPSDAAIVRMVIGMARELEHTVIAEGVETVDQLAFLKAHGCHAYQGFYASRPLPPADATACFAGWSA